MEEKNFGYLGFTFQQSLIKAIIEDKKYGETIVDVIEGSFWQIPFSSNSVDPSAVKKLEVGAGVPVVVVVVVVVSFLSSSFEQKVNVAETSTNAAKILMCFFIVMIKL